MIHEAPQPLICIINNENEDDVAYCTGIFILAYYELYNWPGAWFFNFKFYISFMMGERDLWIKD